MKIAVYRDGLDEVSLKFAEVRGGYIPKYPNYEFLGCLVGDFVVEKPKKTVVKEAKRISVVERANFNRIAHQIPFNAKNVKCTYEVEESYDAVHCGDVVEIGNCRVNGVERNFVITSMGDDKITVKILNKKE